MEQLLAQETPQITPLAVCRWELWCAEQARAFRRTLREVTTASAKLMQIAIDLQDQAARVALASEGRE
jgi:peroxiredoxin